MQSFIFCIKARYNEAVGSRKSGIDYFYFFSISCVLLSIRGIYFAKYYGKGGGEWCWVKKNENEAVRNKMKKKEKGERKKRKGKGGE